MINQTESESAVAVQPFFAGGKGVLAGHGPLIRDSLGYLMSKVVPGFFGLSMAEKLHHRVAEQPGPGGFAAMAKKS